MGAVIDWTLSLPVSGARVRVKPPRALTADWFQARRGRITASTRAQIIEEADPEKWIGLARQLREELHPDWQHVDIDAPPMRWGREHEREALDAVGHHFGCRVFEPGLLLHPEYDYAGATPDGFLGDDTTVQVKCPFSTKNHMKTVLDSMMSAQYYSQVQFEGWITGRRKILYGSYDPRVPADIRLHLIDVPWDEDMWKSFEINLQRFRENFELDNFVRPGKLRVESGIADVF